MDGSWGSILSIKVDKTQIYLKCNSFIIIFFIVDIVRKKKKKI